MALCPECGKVFGGKVGEVCPQCRRDDSGDISYEDMDALGAFVGDKSSYYLKAWEPSLSKQSTRATFNWAGFFLGSFWLLYRKMYGSFFLVFALSILIDGINRVYLLNSLPGMASTLVIGLVCGFWGNIWYLTRAKRILKEIGEKAPDEKKKLEVLAQRGGTSFFPPIVFLVIIFFLILISA